LEYQRLNSLAEIIDKIKKNEKLKDYQKDTLIDGLTKQVIDPQKFLEAYFPSTGKQFIAGAEYFPQAVTHHLLQALSDKELEMRIGALTHKGRYHNNIVSYYENCRSAPEKKYEHISNIISTLWINSRKDPSIFENSKNFEPVMQNIPGYRDHFIHSFYVFLLGYYIINRLWEILNTNTIQYLGSNEPNLTWMLSSTFHDVAYPIERIESWLGVLLGSFIGINPRNYFNFENVIPQIYYDFMKMICRYHKSPTTGFSGKDDISSIDWSFYNTVNSKLLEKDHGVLGGLILAHQLAARDRFIEDGQAWDFFNKHLPACHSICLHHLDIKIDFAKHPFAFLLVLCDEIQDWGRPAKQANRDHLFLRDIEIVMSEIPEIHLVVAISENRKKELAGVLLRRLKTSGKIKVEIKDFKGKEVLVI